MRSLMSQVDQLSYGQRASEEWMHNVQGTIMSQENKFKQEVKNVSEALVRFAQESDDKIAQMSAQFRSESDKVVHASKSNIDNLVAINEEMESIMGRQNSISERVQLLSRSDNEMNTKLEEMRQFFTQEIDDFRKAVLRTSVLAGGGGGGGSERGK